MAQSDNEHDPAFDQQSYVFALPQTSALLHLMCACVIACVCVCIGTGVGVWSRHMGWSSSIQPHQVSHHSHQHHKIHSPYSAFCPLQEIIFSTDNITVSILSAFARVRAGAEGAAGSLFVCVSVHGCVCLCVCLQWGHHASVLALFAVTPVPWRWECNFSDIPYLQFIMRSINQPQHKISQITATLRCAENKIWMIHYDAKISQWL